MTKPSPIFFLPATAPFLLAVILFLDGACRTRSATINAASGSFVAVSNAVALSHPGDTVIIPPGTNIWNQSLKISGITLSGSGANHTLIYDEEVGDPAPVISMPSTPNRLTRLSSLTIASDSKSSQSFHGKVIAYGSAPTQWRIDNVVFNRLKGDSIFTYGTAISVIDHCSFFLQGTAVTTWGSGYGDLSWATPAWYGTSNALYVENCFFTNVVPNSSSSAAMDGLAGARVVFRYNTVKNTFWANHGTESGQRYRSERSYEIYENIFNDNQGFVCALQTRGGTGVIFNNTVNGYNYFINMNNYRSTDPFPPFGGATGFNPWDSNSPTVFLSDVHGGTNNSPFLLVPSANWTVNQWSGYTINDTSTGRFCLITGNTANQMYMESPKDAQPITFKNGDVFAIYYCYPALDQVGVGSGDLLSGDGTVSSPVVNSKTGTAGWPHEVSEPLYVWGNTLNGNPTGLSSGYPNIQENRDFFNNTPKPGYAPFAFPHPLTVSALFPPSNLNAH